MNKISQFKKIKSQLKKVGKNVGETQLKIVNEFVKNDIKIKKEKIEDPIKIANIRYKLMYKCFGIISSDVDKKTKTIDALNRTIERLRHKLGE